jgi:hypothetical protein
MPDDFLTSIRTDDPTREIAKLSDDLVEDYKSALIKIEKGRRVIVDLLQPYSSLPLENIPPLAQSLNTLHVKLKSNYKYLTVKPFILDVFKLAGCNLESNHEELEESKDFVGYRLFEHYQKTGEEPSLADQVKFQFAIAKMFKFIKKNGLLSDQEYAESAKSVSRISHHLGSHDLQPKARKILNDLIIQSNLDQEQILKKLAATFVEEYKRAEEAMKIHYRMIQTELACTDEYLRQVASSADSFGEDQENRVKIAMEKLVTLRETFSPTPSQAQSAAAKSLDELEGAALSISTVMSPTQLTGWIRIYSIIFSNASFLKNHEDAVELPEMRMLISHLTTYHLAQNIAQTKVMIERKLTVSGDEKHAQFKRFNNVLKLKLQGLMGAGKQKEKSLGEMIKELVFLQNETVQFLIAETFEGFQIIVDALNSTTNDYFVRDREALLHESRSLYNEICNQCLKGVVNRPAPRQAKTAPDGGTKKKTWLSRLFS